MEPKHTRSTVIDINLDALTHNFEQIKQLVSPAQVMPIVKGNAYGHGLVQCAQHLQSIGAQWLGVALLEEGIALRTASITIPIVVLGGILGKHIALFLEHDLDITAASVMKLQAIEEQARIMQKRARIHLEIDTGMERTGIHYYNAHKLIECAANVKQCDVISVFSHFATAEDPDTTFAQMQLHRFLESISLFQKYDLPMPLRHIASSGTIMQLPESHLDIVRPGLMLYGIAPVHHLQNKLDLKPVMSLRSRVVYFKVVKEGAGVGYGLTWKASQNTRIVTVPIGYGDGYARKFASGGQVIIRGKRYPIVGRICMDQFMVNIGNDDVFNDDEVILVGAQGNEAITIEELTSKIDDGNAREIMTSFGDRIPRRYRKCID